MNYRCMVIPLSPEEINEENVRELMTALKRLAERCHKAEHALWLEFKGSGRFRHSRPLRAANALIAKLKVK